MSDSKMYIPPHGLYFRLFGYASQRILFSRTHAEPQVFHHPIGEEYNDQFFTLVPSTGARKGLYLMKSKHANKVLFSCTHSDPHVGHINGNGDYNDKYVVLSLFVLQGERLKLTAWCTAGSSSSPARANLPRCSESSVL